VLVIHFFADDLSFSACWPVWAANLVRKGRTGVFGIVRGVKLLNNLVFVVLFKKYFLVVGVDWRIVGEDRWISGSL
jgi:hypothetical protein